VVCVSCWTAVEELLEASSMVEFRSSVVIVPVKVGEAPSVLVAMAVAIASNSTSISVPRTTLLALPDSKESLAVKLVVLE
jgi:hypothetical protein